MVLIQIYYLNIIKIFPNKMFLILAKMKILFNNNLYRNNNYNNRNILMINLFVKNSIFQKKEANFYQHKIIKDIPR